jgi:hypothetical protein
MTNDAEAQEIQGTVVSSGRFPEPADQAEVSTPEDQEKEKDDEERPDSPDLGNDRATADRGEEGEVVDPDAVIIDQDDEDDEDENEDEDEDDETDETPAYAETNEAPADDAAADDETPAAVAGFARTPVAFPASAAPGDAPGAEASTDAAEHDHGVAEEVDEESAVTSATVVTVAGADSVPEADVIAEATRPGMPGDAGAPAMSGIAGDPARLHEQWSAIQSSFVDDPRASVAAAADLVSEAIEALVASVRERERGLREEWERGGADTEDLRNTLRGYRGLLDQLAAL